MTKTKPASGHGIKTLSMPRNHCFACGQDNPQGMHLKFYFDEQQRRAFCRFNLAKRYQGPPGHAHGGIIATILDEAMGKVNKLRSVVALTKSMEVKFLKPVPLGRTLVVEGTEERVAGRRHVNAASIKNQAGEILAQSRGVFIAVDAQKMFARLLAGLR